MCNWIPCKEKMPNDGDRVLVQMRYYGIHIATYQCDKICAWKVGHCAKKRDAVTAWMPLPKEYIEGLV